MSYVSHMSLSISGVKILTIIINICIYYNSAYKSIPHDSKTLMTPMTCMTPMTHSVFGVIRAMKTDHRLRMRYQKFEDEGYVKTVCPCVLKRSS